MPHSLYFEAVKRAEVPRRYQNRGLAVRLPVPEVLRDIPIAVVAVDQRFGEIAVSARADDQVRYRAEITGTSDGNLSFQVWATPDGNFSTNRTGFVVLHPIDGVAGEAVCIERTDGTIVDSTFPREIDPIQPMMDLRALTHWAGDRLEVTLRMEGDIFEMEDQRNWSDASYKTYPPPQTLDIRLEKSLGF